jgi:hypothetical protein
MSEPRTARRAPGDTISVDDPHKALRELGSRAHQLRAATRAADHFNALDTGEDRNTGSWLMSSALALSADVAADIDGLSRALKERPADAALRHAVVTLRIRAHQLAAAARAADHFLDQETREDRETGGWLIATALTLATKLAAEIDDCAAPVRRAASDAAGIEAHDPGLVRRMAAATTPARGAA